jgi:hypothetical protein
MAVQKLSRVVVSHGLTEAHLAAQKLPASRITVSRGGGRGTTRTIAPFRCFSFVLFSCGKLWRFVCTYLCPKSISKSVLYPFCIHFFFGKKSISLFHLLALGKPTSVVRQNVPSVVARILVIPRAVSSHAVSMHAPSLPSRRQKSHCLLHNPLCRLLQAMASCHHRQRRQPPASRRLLRS